MQNSYTCTDEHKITDESTHAKDFHIEKEKSASAHFIISRLEHLLRNDKNLIKGRRKITEVDL